MGLPVSAAVTLGLLFFLTVGLNEQVVEGCRCVQKDLHQAWCHSDTVIRAKVTGKMSSATLGLSAYKVTTIETFKHVNRMLIRFIYTHHNSCEVHLQNKEYLLSGHVENGKVFVNLCDFVKRWGDVSSAEKQYLCTCQMRGCNCGIVPSS